MKWAAAPTSVASLFERWAYARRLAAKLPCAVFVRSGLMRRLMLMLLSWIQIIGYFKGTCRCIVANGCNWTTWQLFFSHQLWCENFRPRCFQKGQRLRTRSPVEVEMYLTCSTKVTPQVNQAAGWPGSYEDMATASGLSPKKWLSSVLLTPKTEQIPGHRVWGQEFRAYFRQESHQSCDPMPYRIHIPGWLVIVTDTLWLFNIAMENPHF